LSYTSETLVEVLIIPNVITNQPSLPITYDLNTPEGLPLADPDFRHPGPIDLNKGCWTISLINDRCIPL